ncbi:conserved hypothetical protein [Candida albicans WO-1]|uniref:Uncharacterized protein n=1 Tax=Candida albicans (strain WO-1) TaxID=294748 RepID=C4YSH9_CANAW|nr:conserved hypothetical protein [Candida albicans WO-1]
MTKSYMPLFRSPRQFKKIYFILIPLILAVIILHVFFDGFNKISEYSPTFISNRILNHQDQQQKSEKSSDVISSYFPSLAIYPKNFDNRVEFVNEPKNSKWIQYFGDSKTVLSNYITNQTYTNHSIGLYSSSTNKLPASSCKDILYERSFEITKYRTLHDDLYKLATTLLYQLENDPAFQDLSPFFNDRLPHIIMRGELHKHIYKFAGTSVWLEQHGVHLMLSRVIYSQQGKKNDPQLSLLYAQVYDENWNELNDIELIVPVINPNGERVYDSVKYPQFVAIPFYHNSEYIKSRWYGPEDTRLILTKNKFGDDEPAIIFNSYHRQIKDMSTEDDNNVHTKFEFYRSMFVGWLFQYQLGKLNTDGIQDSKFNNVTFNKVKELRIEGKERTSVEKNWTPFIDPDERNQISYYGNHNLGDNYVYIVYQWNHLKILKCELDNFIDSSHSTCTMFFKDVETTQEVGPVRGGTELWPIKIDNNNNNNLNEDDLSTKQEPQQQRQLWIGFLRAHVKDCGCGGSMYRPNFLILEKLNSKFKLTYLSGSINFNVSVYGWANYDVVCAGHEANALIPNGISMFDQDDDYLTLSMSVADQDNTLVHIHGVKKLIYSLDHDWNGILKENKQIECVVNNANDFCKAYADEHYKLGDSEAAIKEVKQKAKEEAEKAKAEKEKAEKEKAEKEKAEKEKEEKEKEEKEEKEKAEKEKEEKEKAEKELAEKELAGQKDEDAKDEDKNEDKDKNEDEDDKEKNDESGLTEKSEVEENGENTNEGGEGNDEEEDDDDIDV